MSAAISHVEHTHSHSQSLASPSSAAGWAVEARGVTKVFGTGPLAFQALRGVDFTARRGEVVMLAGPSGSGKTTLLSILGCVLRASSGLVRLLGEDITALPESRLPEVRLTRIGFVFQGHNLLTALSALDNVALPLRLQGVSDRESRERSAALLSRVGLGGKEQSLPNQLSGGQRQRVAIARALVGSPPILLADEPTAALDAKSGLVVTELIRELARERGVAAVVVTHDNRIFHLADRVVHIEDGLIQDQEHSA